MICKALITSGLNERTITAKSGKNAGKDFTFRTLNVIDTEAQKQSVLELQIHENDITEAQILQGKTCLIHVFAADGKYYFGGVYKQAQMKQAA